MCKDIAYTLGLFLEKQIVFVEVANLVLADVKDAPTGEYVNAVTVYAVLNNGVYTVVTGGEPKYSKYTQGELVNVKKMYPIA